MNVNHELLAAPQIAELLGVRPSLIYTWRTRGQMPAPDLVISGRPAWRHDRIVRWAVKTGRWPEGST